MDEKFYRYIASEYASRYGAELRRELDALSQNGAPQITPSLDRRVRGAIGALKRKRYARITGLIAACLFFVLTLPAILHLYQRELASPAPPAQSASASEAHAPPTQSSEPPASPAPEPAPAYEILPLSFSLPEQFSVASVEQDIEKTVYHLDNTELDDVVMTMQLGGDIALFDTLVPISIDGRQTYGSSGNGYSLLAFENRDVLYVLTCKHDINTLVHLSESILL